MVIGDVHDYRKGGHEDTFDPAHDAIVWALYSAYGTGINPMDGEVVRHLTTHPHGTEPHLCTGAYSVREVLHFSSYALAANEAAKYTHPASGRHPVAVAHILDEGTRGQLVA